MDLLTAIHQRRSHRGDFESKPICQKHLDQLIEAARWAPSPFNVQPWKLLIILDVESKNTIADLTQSAITEQLKDARFLDDNSRWVRLSDEEWMDKKDGILLSDHLKLPPPFERNLARAKPILKNAGLLSFLGHMKAGRIPAKEISDQIRNSPILILIVMDYQRRPPGDGSQRWMWLGMGAMIQNLLLTAAALEIGVQFVSAPIERAEDRKTLGGVFNMPPSCEIISLLRVGYAKQINQKSVRLDPSEFVCYESF